MTRRERAKERVADARAAASERVADAAAVASERVAEAKTAADEFIARQKPRLRGVSHEWAFFVSLVAGAPWCSPRRPAGDGRRGDLRRLAVGAARGQRSLSPGQLAPARDPPLDAAARPLDDLPADRRHRDAVRRAGPRRRRSANALLIAVWAGAAAGIVVELVWVEAPKWATAIVYLAVGWIGALGFPGIVVNAGLGAGALIAVGGALYTAGAVSTPASARTPTRRCSATTRSSTCW